MELSEAAALADHFVFRLMFRAYDLPDAPPPGTPLERTGFFERKRLLRAFSAKSWPVGSKQRIAAGTRYLVLSALALDGGTGACPALVDNRCSIWRDRPLTCRSVPLHYSIPDASLVSRFDAFVATPGYACDTGPDAPLLIDGGKPADPTFSAARAEANALTGREARWKQAIVSQMRIGQAYSGSMPTREQIDQHASAHALTVPMAVAWQVAAFAGLMEESAVADLVGRQLRCIDGALASQRWNAAERETLVEMRADYSRTWPLAER